MKPAACVPGGDHFFNASLISMLAAFIAFDRSSSRRVSAALKTASMRERGP